MYQMVLRSQTGERLQLAPLLAQLGDAQAGALVAFGRLVDMGGKRFRVEVWDTANPGTVADAVDDYSFAQGYRTVNQVAAGVNAQTIPEPEPDYGDEVSDDDYILGVTSDGYAQVYPSPGLDDASDVSELPPGSWSFRSGDSNPFDAPAASYRWFYGVKPDDVIEAQDENAETPTLTAIVPIDNYAYPPPYVKTGFNIPWVGFDSPYPDIPTWRQHAKDTAVPGNPNWDYPYQFTRSDTDETDPVILTSAVGQIPCGKGGQDPDFGTYSDGVIINDPSVFPSGTPGNPMDWADDPQSEEYSFLGADGTADSSVSFSIKGMSVMLARPFTPLPDDPGPVTDGVINAGFFFRALEVKYLRANVRVSTSVSGRGGVYTYVDSFNPDKDGLLNYAVRVQPGTNRLPMRHPKMYAAFCDALLDLNGETDPNGTYLPLGFDTAPYVSRPGVQIRRFNEYVGGWTIEGPNGQPGTLVGTIIADSPYTYLTVVVPETGPNFVAYEYSQNLDAQVDWRQWHSRIVVRAVYVARGLDGEELEYRSSGVMASAFCQDFSRYPMNARHRDTDPEGCPGEPPPLYMGIDPAPVPTQTEYTGKANLWVLQDGAKMPLYPQAESVTMADGRTAFWVLYAPQDTGYVELGYGIVGYNTATPDGAGGTTYSQPVYAKGPYEVYLPTDTNLYAPSFVPGLMGDVVDGADALPVANWDYRGQIGDAQDPLNPQFQMIAYKRPPRKT